MDLNLRLRHEAVLPQNELFVGLRAYKDVLEAGKG